MNLNNEVKVSVIMPTYNTARFIREAIDSVLSQSFANFELIIVNDGSTDNTNEIIASYNDHRIRYYELEKNRGRGYARNYAISKCTGNYIAICDADDINLPDRLQKQVTFLEQNKDVDIVGGQLLHFSGNKIPRKLYHFPESPAEVAGFFKRGLMGVPHAACMLRKECFQQLKYEDQIAYNVEDFELFLQLNNFFKMASLGDPLVLYRNDLSQTTLEKIKLHELYHHYAIYSATSKLNNATCDDFASWSATYRKKFSHRLSSITTYYKIRAKLAIHRFKYLLQ